VTIMQIKTGRWSGATVLLVEIVMPKGSNRIERRPSTRRCGPSLPRRPPRPRRPRLRSERASVTDPQPTLGPATCTPYRTTSRRRNHSGSLWRQDRCGESRSKCSPPDRAQWLFGNAHR
jgi:hypothetical protein